jgi:lysozyme family protein
MIIMVILQQEEVWKDFSAMAWPDFWKDGKAAFSVDPPQHLTNRQLESSPEHAIEYWRKILRTPAQFQKFKQRIERLDEHAARVEQSIAFNLDLKQKFAGIEQAKASMAQAQASTKEAHATALMSAAVFGFTIVTVIFTPLSFILSLFALPIDRFQKNHEDPP